eukprot:comp23031_c0_seq1/m.36817 comp23031_c0_seq1/g.36817  ORF comp23031_c0_seq1/g.36817 comp23031_c0_seq1/m.36817 type:complete len:259 (-) comp23031_c0_seq1:203-979(-)
MSSSEMQKFNHIQPQSGVKRPGVVEPTVAPEQPKFDPEGTIRKMDKQWDTNFRQWVKNQENAECSGQHLAGMLKEFDLNRAAWGVRWIVSNPSWHINNIGTLLCTATATWPIKQRAHLANLVSNDWPLSPYTTRLVYHMIDRMQYEDAVEFATWITETWTIDSALQLLAELSVLYQWDTKLFGAIALRFAWNLKRCRKLTPLDLQHIHTFCSEAHSGKLKGTWLKPGATTYEESQAMGNVEGNMEAHSVQHEPMEMDA